MLQSISENSAKPKPTEEETTSQLDSVPSLCSQLSPCSHGAKLVRDWTVKDVCQFVESMDACKLYSEVSLCNSIVDTLYCNVT